MNISRFSPLPPPPSLIFSWGRLWGMVACLSLFCYSASLAEEYKIFEGPFDGILDYEFNSSDASAAISGEGMIEELNLSSSTGDWTGTLLVASSSYLDIGNFSEATKPSTIYVTGRSYFKDADTEATLILIDDAQLEVGALILNSLQGDNSSATLTVHGGLVINGSNGVTDSYAGSMTGSIEIRGAGYTFTTSHELDSGVAVYLDSSTLILGAGGTLDSLFGSGTLNTSADLTINYNNTYEPSTFEGSITAQNGDTKKTITKTGDGTLKINASGSNNITVEKFIQTAGELDIKGVLNGGLELTGGTFSPGNSIGDIDVNGATNIKDSALMSFEIESASSHDYLKTTTLDVDKYGFIELDILGTFEDSEEIPILTYTTLDAGIYDDVAQWLNSAPANWSLTQSGNTIYAKYTKDSPEPGTSVPEPSTWALLILGFTGLMWYRKRERR